MKRVKSILFLSVLFLSLATAANAQNVADTPENRRQAARQYLKTQPVKEIMEDVISKITDRLLNDVKSEELKEMMMVNIRYDTMRTAVVETMVEHFTVAEIKALTHFYSTPAGRSVMEKMGAYMADLRPIIMKEVKRAMRLTMQSIKDEQQAD